MKRLISNLRNGGTPLSICGIAVLWVILIQLATYAHAQGTLFGGGRSSGSGIVAIQPIPPQFSLTVSVAGTGTVIASPNGVGGLAISCPPSCSANYNTGAIVTLSESPGAGQTFSGWSGAASGCGLVSSCVLIILGNTSATATFTGSGCGISPCSYNARTDGCYFSVSQAATCTPGTTCASVCNPSLTPGEQQGGLGALLKFTEGTTDPLPFPTLASGNAGQNTCFTDPDFGTYSCWLTDNNPSHMNGANAIASWDLGSDGGYDAWNNDSTMVAPANNGSVQQLFHIIPSRIHNQTCTPTNPCIITSNLKSGTLNGTVGTCPGSPGHDNFLFDTNAGLVFSRDVLDGNNIMFEPSPTGIQELTISVGMSGGVPTGVDCITRTKLVDFTSDSPVACSVLAPGYNSLWNGQASVSNTDTFTVASGGGSPWPAVIGNPVGNGSQSVTSDNFTLPTNNLSISAGITAIQGVSGTVTMTTANIYFAYVGESTVISGTTNYNGTATIVTANNTTHTYTFAGATAASESGGTAKVSMKNISFQATTAGTTGRTGHEPNWIATCPLLGMTCADNDNSGTAVWTNVGGTGGQGPGYDVMNYRPGIGCKYYNSRTHKTRNGTGNSEPSGQVMTDDATVCNQMGGSNCGTGGTVAIKDIFTLHAGSQTLDSRYATITPTGGGSVSNTFGNGSCTPPVNAGFPNPVFPYWPGMIWSSTYNTPTGYAGTNYVVSPIDHNYYKKQGISGGLGADPSTDTVNWKFAGSLCYDYQMEWATNILRPCLELGPNFGCDAHRAEGALYFYQGGRYYAHLYGQPSCQTMNANCPYGFNATQGGVTETGYTGGPNPGVQALPIAGCADGHPTYRNVGLLDLQPFFIPRGDVPSWPTRFTCSTYDVVESVANLTSNPSGQQVVWRHGTPFNSGSSALFSNQNAIGVISQAGDLLAIGSDGMNTRGDRLATNNTCQHPFRGQYAPAVGTPVTVNDVVLPVTANNTQVIYTVTSCGGPSSCTPAALPAWNSCQTAGCTIAAGGVTYQALGPNSCRGDVLIMDVLSSHIAP